MACEALLTFFSPFCITQSFIYEISTTVAESYKSSLPKQAELHCKLWLWAWSCAPPHTHTPQNRTQKEVKDQQLTKSLCGCAWIVRQCVSERAASLSLMSLCVAETERLMHCGSSPLAATGLPRATADDSFNCFQSFRLVPAQWRRVLVCVHVWHILSLGCCVCVCLHRGGTVCGFCTHMRCVFDECVFPFMRRENY